MFGIHHSKWEVVMSSQQDRFKAVGIALVFALALFGCSGSNSALDEETILTAQSFDENCALCHRSGSIADVAEIHGTESSSSVNAKITGVAVNDGTGKVTISFKVFDSENSLIPITGVAKADIRFTIAQLVADGDGVYNWQSYINTTEVKDAGEPGNASDGTATPDGSSKIQATSERANAGSGVFTDLLNGTYTYVMALTINTVTTPLAVTYDNTLTHRVAMQLSGNESNAFYDFVPDGVTDLRTHDIADNASCNECHIKLGLHGGDRIQIELCATCHNPGTYDANSGNVVDLKVMIHKIHAGEELPEVQADGEYAIWGYGNSKHDYSTVVFPQDLRNCTTCHDGADAATLDGDNWKDVPSTDACTACHADPEADDYVGFPNLTAVQIAAAHAIPSKTAAGTFEYTITSVTNTAPGQYPSVTFKVTDPTNADAAYDILTDAPFTASGGASSLNILIGWETADYSNTGSGRTPAQPLSISALSSSNSTDNGDGTFTVTSTVAIPSTAVGSGVVAMEGHPAGDFDGDTTYSDRVPVTGVTEAFAITDSSAVSRREVVDIDNCNKCHNVLSLHGSNRTGEPQLCVICHNADATDIGRRPTGTTAVDGKVEEAIDFKTMIHSIHAGKADEHGFRENGIVVYGYNSSVNDFSHVRLPNGEENLMNCAGCHSGTTYMPPLDDTVLPTTILTNTDLESPDDDTNITPTTAVCSSCHDSVYSKTHMAEEGGLFNFVPFIEEAASSANGEITLCAPGPVASQPGGHSSRNDCCSCHSI
ncbi:MAG: OmcA/MtrC family decaheme c-type cytochrome [Proteobacteria bacterium]|nr:OmcA/MtrC family decaheme c-type cytochrome [Pseudomonadota bacterium]